MEKQHNRGQDGAGVANIKFDIEPGNRYIARKRSNSNKPIQDIFAEINQRFAVHFLVKHRKVLSYLLYVQLCFYHC